MHITYDYQGTFSSNHRATKDPSSTAASLGARPMRDNKVTTNNHHRE